MKLMPQKGAYSKQGTLILAIIFAAIALLGLVSIVSPDTPAKIAAPDETVSSQGTYSSYLTKVMVVTFTMLIVLVIGLRIYKKQMVLHGKNNLFVTVMGRHYISDKQYLLKVVVEGKAMLLGITDASISYLTDLEDTDDPEAASKESFGKILDLETNREQDV